MPERPHWPMPHERIERGAKTLLTLALTTGAGYVIGDVWDRVAGNPQGIMFLGQHFDGKGLLGAGIGLLVSSLFLVGKHEMQNVKRPRWPR